MAPIEKNLLRQARLAGDPIPRRIKEKPRLGLGLDLFLDAFFDLEHDRQWIVGNTAQPLPISWGIIVEYAKAYELTGSLREELLYFVRELDCAYIKHLNKKGV